MIYLCIGLLISNIVVITYLLKEKEKIKKEKEKTENLIQLEIQKRADKAVADHLEKSKQSIEQVLQANYNQRKKELDEQYQRDTQSAEASKKALKTAIEAQESQIQQMKNDTNKIVEEYRQSQEIQIQAKIDQAKLDQFDLFAQEFEILMADYNRRRAECHKEIMELFDQLENYRAKRNALNEEILRQRAIEEKEDFYKVVLDEAALHDLALLNEIKSQFSKVDLIQKLEYDNYVGKPALEMVKRVLEGKQPSGIYKITRLKTGEVYIGKSTNIRDRWIQHCKSAFHCGTISHSTLHTTMERDGINNFTFELLEEVSKEKLTEREKYWIEFYDSKNYGLNEKVG